MPHPITDFRGKIKCYTVYPMKNTMAEVSNGQILILHIQERKSEFFAG